MKSFLRTAGISTLVVLVSLFPRTLRAETGNATVSVEFEAGHADVYLPGYIEDLHYSDQEFNSGKLDKDVTLNDSEVPWACSAPAVMEAIEKMSSALCGAFQNYAQSDIEKEKNEGGHCGKDAWCYHEGNAEFLSRVEIKNGGTVLCWHPTGCIWKSPSGGPGVPGAGVPGTF